jgi:hypothetical protein
MRRFALLAAVTAAGPIAVAAGQTSSALTFGKTTVGATCAGMDANLKRVNRYSISSGGTVSSLSIYLKPTSTSGTQSVEGIIYADNGGAPGALIGATTPLSFSSTNSAGWYTLRLQSPRTLAAGAYWIGIMTGGTQGVAGYCFDSGASRSRDMNGNQMSSGPSTPFGSFTQDRNLMSVYATYTAPSAPTVSLTANPASITSGASSTLTWSSANATSCAATSPSSWTAATTTSGSQSVTPTATTTYTITCTGAGGMSASSSATVTVSAASSPPPPPPPSGTPARTPPGIPLPAIPSSAHYLSPSGSDSNPGTQAAPWQTIEKAVTAAQPGDTVVFEAGTYGATSTRTDWTSAGTAASPITFIGDPAASSRPTILGYNVLQGAHVRVWNLDFAGPTGVMPNEGTQEVMIWMHANDQQVNDSEVSNSQWHAGIYVDNGDGDKIIGDWVHGNGAFSDSSQANEDQGIYWDASTGTTPGVIADCLVQENYSFGIQLYPNAVGVDVEWNTIVANGTSSGGGGIVVDSAASNNTIQNNIIASNTGHGGVFQGGVYTGSNNLIQNNDIYGNTGLSWPSSAGTLTVGSGNVTTDPRFVGTGTDPYNLQSGSPAIGHYGAYQNGHTGF